MAVGWGVPWLEALPRTILPPSAHIVGELIPKPVYLSELATMRRQASYVHLDSSEPRSISSFPSGT